VDIATAGRFLNYLNGGPDGCSTRADVLVGQAPLKADAECAAGGIVQAVLDYQQRQRSSRGNGDHPDYMAAAR
jgi:hypothetical protein